MIKNVISSFLLLSLIYLQNIYSDQSTVLPINEEGLISFDSIIEVPNTSKEILFLKCMEWFANSFNDSKEVLEIKDKDAGILLGKGFIDTHVWMKNPNGVEFTITVKVKDNKIKYTLTNFTHKDLDESNYPGEGGRLEQVKPSCGILKLTPKHWKEIKDIVYTNVNGLIKSLIKTLQDNTSDDW